MTELKNSSDLERAFAFHLRRHKLRGFVTEYPFGGISGNRQWRFDVAWPEEKVACEVMGGLQSNGKHSREEGYMNDAIKSFEAQLLGWKVFAITPAMIEEDRTAMLITEALGRR